MGVHRPSARNLDRLAAEPAAGRRLGTRPPGAGRGSAGARREPATDRRASEARHRPNRAAPDADARRFRAAEARADLAQGAGQRGRDSVRGRSDPRDGKAESPARSRNPRHLGPVRLRIARRQADARARASGARLPRGRDLRCRLGEAEGGRSGGRRGRPRGARRSNRLPPPRLGTSARTRRSRPPWPWSRRARRPAGSSRRALRRLPLLLLGPRRDRCGRFSRHRPMDCGSCFRSRSRLPPQPSSAAAS